MKLDRAHLRPLAALALLLAPWAPARAQPAPAEQQNPTPGEGAPSPAPAGLFAGTRANLLGDLGGLRPQLNDRGLSLGLSSSNEVFAVGSGGIRRGATLAGLTQFGLGVDTGKAFGLPGGTFNLSALWIYGPNFSANYTGALQTASGIVAQPTVRLWEVWYQQAFGDRLDVKAGMQSLDQEFMTSVGSGLFLNTMMGWPMIPSANLYAGGPAYPLSSLGLRLRGRPTGALTLLGGVFQDNPPGGPFQDDGQRRGATRWGGNFNLRTGALFMAEAQYRVNQPAEEGTPAKGGLPGTYKIGAWFDTARFPDQRWDTQGLSLADPASSGEPRLRRHDWSLYAVADQTVWQPDRDKPLAVSLFARPMVAPDDRNLISFSINAGATVKAPFPGRDDDSFGIGFGVADVSRRARDLDRDAAALGAYSPRRGTETFIELTYQFQLAGWWQVQPDFQYVWMPGGGVANPRTPDRRIGNTAIFGLRTNITF